MKKILFAGKGTIEEVLNQLQEQIKKEQGNK